MVLPVERVGPTLRPRCCQHLANTPSKAAVRRQCAPIRVREEFWSGASEGLKRVLTTLSGMAWMDRKLLAHSRKEFKLLVQPGEELVAYSEGEIPRGARAGQGVQIAVSTLGMLVGIEHRDVFRIAWRAVKKITIRKDLIEIQLLDGGLHLFKIRRGTKLGVNDIAGELLEGWWQANGRPVLVRIHASWNGLEQTAFRAWREAGSSTVHLNYFLLNGPPTEQDIAPYLAADALVRQLLGLPIEVPVPDPEAIDQVTWAHDVELFKRVRS